MECPFNVCKDHSIAAYVDISLPFTIWLSVIDTVIGCTVNVEIFAQH